MNRDQVTRSDFPREEGGYDRASVDAHLLAVDALIAACEAEVAALKVERDALRRSAPVIADGASREGSGSGSANPAVGTATAPGPVSDASTGSGTAGAAGSGTGGGGDEEVSARLVATKMLMDGIEREAIRIRLEEEFDLEDTDGLIDDLFERLG